MVTLQNKVAVVTGGGSGIGRSIALALASAGTHVVVADIHIDSAEAVAAEAQAKGVRALAVRCDVADHGSVAALADAAYSTFGTVDILCNNAGISWRPYRSILDATLDDWRFMLGINLWGVIHCLDAFLPRMRRQAGEKHIVNTASLGGLIPMEGHSIYSAGKAAVVGLSEAIAAELAPHGFGVTIFCPGSVRTNLGENTVRIRGEVPAELQQQFEPVATPTLQRFAKLPIISAEDAGTMVCQAIRDNTLYLHSAALPHDLIADRVHRVYGPQTLPRAGKD